MKSKLEKAEYMVVRGQGVPLLGKQTARKLGVLKVAIDVAAVSTYAEQFHQEFPEVFTGLGKLKNTQTTLHVDPSFPPVPQPLRRTPAARASRGKTKTVSWVGYHRTSGRTTCQPGSSYAKTWRWHKFLYRHAQSKWGHSSRTPPDPHGRWSVTRPEWIKVFSELDLNMGYHQLELDPESREITT